MIQDELTEKVIACAMRVHNMLGPGFLESVYQNALLTNFGTQRLQFKRKHRQYKPKSSPVNPENPVHPVKKSSL